MTQQHGLVDDERQRRQVRPVQHLLTHLAERTNRCAFSAPTSCTVITARA